MQAGEGDYDGHELPAQAQNIHADELADPGRSLLALESISIALTAAEPMTSNSPQVAMRPIADASAAYASAAAAMRSRPRRQGTPGHPE